MAEEHSEAVVKLAIFSVVVGVWAIAFAWDIFNQNFEVPVAAHTLVGTIIGYFVGSRIKKSSA